MLRAYSSGLCVQVFLLVGFKRPYQGQGSNLNQSHGKVNALPTMLSLSSPEEILTQLNYSNNLNVIVCEVQFLYSGTIK